MFFRLLTKCSFAIACSSLGVLNTCADVKPAIFLEGVPAISARAGMNLPIMVSTSQNSFNDYCSEQKAAAADAWSDYGGIQTFRCNGNTQDSSWNCKSDQVVIQLEPW